jgi:hypothetical protein
MMGTMFRVKNEIEGEVERIIHDAFCDARRVGSSENPLCTML